MTAPDLLRAVVTAPETAEIPFMLTGSLAAAVHGAGRATMDMDLVIEPTAERLRVLVGALSKSTLYVSQEAALEALEHESMFNVVDTTTGWKADLIVRKSRPFSRMEFERRRPSEYEGTRLWVATAEDLIVTKLEWAKLSGSARQIEDVAGLLRVTGGELDAAYLQRWIADLDLHAQWEAARAQG